MPIISANGGHWPAAKIRTHRAAAIMFLDHAIDNSRSWFEYRPAYTALALAATLTPIAWAGDESFEHSARIEPRTRSPERPMRHKKPRSLPNRTVVGEIPENTATTQPAFRRDARIPFPPQPVKIEADDVAARECSRKQADPLRPKAKPDDHNRARCTEEREAATKKVDLHCMPYYKGLRRHREEKASAFEWINYAPRYGGPQHGRSWLVTRLKPVD
jgi:hypothetical protein